MNPELAQWQALAFHDGKFHNSLVALIVEAVWPGTTSLPEYQQSVRFGAVKDVLAEAPSPILSQKDRQAILDAAGPILAGARP